MSDFHRYDGESVINADGKNVLQRMQFYVGATGKPLKEVIAVGIGGSFLGPLFLHTALQTDPEALECAKGRQLRLLLSSNNFTGRVSTL